MKKEKQSVSEALLRWYDENAREMPWRGISDPWGSWVSEIMLQQTRVETVRDYYPRFMKRFPTPRALAEAPEEDALKMWEGLGYYSRVRNLREGARQVMREWNGQIPRKPEELRRIKGIGPYTSCSVASIAFGVPVPAVDGNVIRVICRLYQLAGNPLAPDQRREIERLAGELVPGDRPGDHNQAMMDLGAMICVPGTPDCGACPLREMCGACAAGTAEELPRLPRARPPKEILYDVLILCSGEKVLLRRREEKMLRGLWCFPMLEGHEKPEELPGKIRKKLDLTPEDLRSAGDAKHVFTHQVWRMNLYTARIPGSPPPPPGYRWAPVSELEKLPFPVAMKAAMEVLRKLEASGHRKIEKNREK